jgi:hypothetical protein
LVVEFAVGDMGDAQAGEPGSEAADVNGQWMAMVLGQAFLFGLGEVAKQRVGVIVQDVAVIGAVGVDPRIVHNAQNGLGGRVNGHAGNLFVAPTVGVADGTAIPFAVVTAVVQQRHLVGDQDVGVVG